LKGLDPPRLLLVDDELDITQPLKFGLQKKGFSVDAENDPVKAMANFRPDSYDIAIIDISMPEIDGFTLGRQIKEVDGDVHIVFLTALDVYKKEFSKMFPKMKVDGFLTKPMSIGDLVDHLNSILEHSLGDDSGR